LFAKTPVTPDVNMVFSLRELSCLEMQQNYVLCQLDDIGTGSFEFPKTSCDRLQTSDLRRDAKPRNVTTASMAAGVMANVHMQLSSVP
jgi:hypothetical protein